MTRDETVGQLARLAATWPSREIGDGTIAEYQSAWADLDAMSVKAAVGAWLREGRFFPSPGEIRVKVPRNAKRQEEDWGLGRCERCDRPAGMRIRERRACWAHADAVFPQPAEEGAAA